MLGSERNCTWQVGSIPDNKTNVEEIKQYNTSELLCSSIVDPPQHATTIEKSVSGASINPWQYKYMSVLTNVKNIRDGPTVHLPNNETMRETRTGNIPLASSLSAHAKKAHIFDGFHSASIISLGQLYDNYCVDILDKNEINILKNKTLILKGHRNKTYGLWDIPISKPARHRSMEIITKDKMIKYAHNTYNRRTRNIPSEDTLFYFRKRRRTAVSVTENYGACWVRTHTLWLMTEWPELEILSIVVVLGLAKSLSWELTPFDNWRLTYTITTTKSNRIGLSSI